MIDLDRYLPETIRNQIESQFYARINQHARLEEIIKDEYFWEQPDRHLGLFSDHGVVHVQDVVCQIHHVLDVINGMLIPKRPPAHLNRFMRGYGVIVAYLHDIGMCDFSRFGRSMHPEFASHYVFSPDFDSIIDVIWQENCGNMAWRLSNLAQDHALTQSPQIVLRELLAMSNCHSKSKVPIQVLNDPVHLRAHMIEVLETDLAVLYRQQLIEKAQRQDKPQADIESAQAALDEALQTTANSQAARENLSRFYPCFRQDAYAWLEDGHPEAEALRADVMDTLRALRTADALRERGTVLKTSAGYQIFVDQISGRAMFGLYENGNSRLYMLAISSEISAGEANLANSELDREGNLRVGFYRGCFDSEQATHYVAHGSAVVINDIQSDVIESFIVPDPDPALKPASDIKILIEGTDDNLDFSELVRQELVALNPALEPRVQTVASLQNTTPDERDRYLQAPNVDWSCLDRNELLEHLADAGQNMVGFDIEQAFCHVRLIHVNAGDTLIQADTPANFVYIPLREGLRVIPLGGYKTFSIRAWIPLGNTGVIRGAMRNATVVSDCDMHLLMIPKEVFLKHWHRPHTMQELRQRLMGCM